MTDSARGHFDSFIHLAGDPARRARDLAGKAREDFRSRTEGLKSGAEQVRERGSRTASDIGRLLRAEFDASLTRMGVATQADLDDLNLRLEHSEEQVRELRLRIAETEARLTTAEKHTESQERPAAAAFEADEDADTSRPAPGPSATEDDGETPRPAPGADATGRDAETPRPATGASATGEGTDTPRPAPGPAATEPSDEEEDA